MNDIPFKLVQQWAMAHNMCVIIRPDGDVVLVDSAGTEQMKQSADAFAASLVGGLGVVSAPSRGAVVLDAPGYDVLADVLSRAFAQAAIGKGAERHATGQSFDEQPMQSIAGLVGVGGPLFQAIKKMQEAQRLPTEAAVRELLGAINYTAGAVIYLEGQANG